MPIGKKVGSIKSLKQDLKKGGGGANSIRYIPKDGSITGRFLHDPEEWINYYEHFDSTLRKSYPCVETNCPGCQTDERRSSRYLANFLDAENDKVIPLQLPKTLVANLVAMYERMDTLLDRDFELVRSGEGLDTTYNAIPEAPMKRKLDKYASQAHDLQAVLDDAYSSVFSAGVQSAPVDDDDDEEIEVAAKRRVKPKVGRRRSAAAHVVDEAEVDDDDDEDDVPEPFPEPDFSNQELEELDKDDDVPLDQIKVDPDVDLVGEDDDDDADYYTEEDLQGMTLGELRGIAKVYGIATRGKSEDELIEAILTPDEDDD